MNKFLPIFLLLIISLFLLGCTSSDTFIIQNTKLEKLFDMNVAGASGQIPFLNLDGNLLEVGGLDYNKDTNVLGGVSNLVPYTGATTNVDLGANDLSVGGANGVNSYMGFNIYQVPDPEANSLTGVISSGGSIGIGNYYYAVTFITATGETHNRYSPVITTDASNRTVTLTVPVSTDPRVTGRKLYRTKVNGANFNDYFLATISDNTTTTYVDTATDASLTGNAGVSYFRANTTSNNITINSVKALTIDTAGTYLGLNAGNALTIGGRNVFLGYLAGERTTSTNDGVIIGNQAGSLSTAIGGSNVIIGSYASRNLTGSSNISIGSYNLFSMTSGASNTSVGFNTGRYIADGSTANTTSTFSVYLGRDAKAGANGNTNEVVIGYNAIGKGSNTAVIGNSSTTGLYLPNDNYKLLFGASSDASISYDGTNLVVNPKEVGSGLVYIDGNISAEQFITRTSVYDKSKGKALSKIKDASKLKDSKGNILHEEFYGYKQFEVTDYSKPVIIQVPYQDCVIDEENQEEKCTTKYSTETTFPHKKMESGVDIVEEIELLRQALFELKTEMCLLEKKYSWCS